MINFKLITVNYISGGLPILEQVLSMTLENLIAKASKNCEIFANPLRCFIAAFLAVKEEATWSELKDAIEKWAGRVNPNTLSFHLGELSTAGFIAKIDVRGQPRYKIVNTKLSELKRLVGEDLLKAVKENA
jgi:DNA-binding transcriptional ArsR family regulator